jgi:hypothetical protein
MHVLIVAFAVLVLIRLLMQRKYADRSLESVGLAIRDEGRAWLLTLAALIGIAILFYVLVLIFGPIPQIHEW